MGSRLMRCLMFALATSSTTSCAKPNGTTPVPCPSYELTSIAGADGVIFPSGSGWVDGYPHGAITRFWTPSIQDVRVAESRLYEYLKTTAPLLADKLQAYARQYTGFYSSERRLIFIQFLGPSSWIRDWRCRPVSVDDGGDTFFQVEYDVDLGVFRNLQVNGNG